MRDTVTENGKLVEDTIDWYAQDKAGNVWYLGEQTAEYENGKVVSTAGSFEAGVDGAQAGIAMPAQPARRVSRTGRSTTRGHAEDKASILSLGEQAEVPVGHFRDVVMTRDVNPLKPKHLEYKLYARGVGPVLVIGVSGGSGREELVRFTRGSHLPVHRVFIPARSHLGNAVLVVEDELRMASVIRRALAREGMVVDVAADGERRPVAGAGGRPTTRSSSTCMLPDHLGLRASAGGCASAASGRRC